MPLIPAALERLADLAAPWQAYYADSKAASATVTFAHVGGMLLAGGLAIAADRQTLRASRDDAEGWGRQLAELAALHRPVVALLVVVVLSGVAMFLADVEELGSSVMCWAKMTLFAALLANGALMTRVEARLRLEARDAVAWDRLRLHAGASALLWLAITLAGVLLQQA